MQWPDTSSAARSCVLSWRTAAMPQAANTGQWPVRLAALQRFEAMAANARSVFERNAVLGSS